VLRPRQVRAGIPRTLDALCDHVLNHGGDTEVSAATLAESLRDFLGPSAAAAEAWLARIEHPRRGDGTVVLPPLPDPPVRDLDSPLAEQEPGEAPEGGPAAGEPAEQASDQTSSQEGLATQAGMPIFHEDTDDVEWLRHHTEKPPPPPAFEPQPERPLFAPDPEEGQPVRRSRAAAVPQGVGGGYWPFENTGPGTGSGVLPAYREDDDRHPPGSSMLRLAGVIAACLVVLVAVVVAFNLGRGKTPLGTTKDHGSQSPSQTTGSSGSATPAPISGVTARDFDPQGGDRAENPQEAPNAVDGDPATAWTTVRYVQQFGAGGLKTGVGLVLDLGATHTVSEVDLTTVGAPTSVAVYVTGANPADLRGLSVAGSSVIETTHGTVSLTRPTEGRYVVVWLTKIPAVPGGFRGGIAEAVVKGD
jgi:hypothetical protein